MTLASAMAINNFSIIVLTIRSSTVHHDPQPLSAGGRSGQMERPLVIIVSPLKGFYESSYIFKVSTLPVT